MKTALQRASAAVATACAMTSTFVHVISFDPLSISPGDLFLRSFGAVGIQDTARIETFRQALISVLPPGLAATIQAISLSPSLQIGLLVNHLEALIAQFDENGGGQ